MDCPTMKPFHTLFGYRSKRFRTLKSRRTMNDCIAQIIETTRKAWKI